MKDPRVILCPVDFSPLSTPILAHAAALARDTGARLVLLHVIEPLLVQAAAMKYDTTYLQDESHRALSILATSLGPGVHRTPPVPRVRIGLPHVEILQAVASEQADLVVIGTQGHHGASRLFFGSTTLRVLRDTPVPVLAVPPAVAGLVQQGGEGPAVALARVVVGIDFSESTESTIRAGAAIARRWDARLVLAHVVAEAGALEQWAHLLASHQQRRIERATRELELLTSEVRGEVAAPEIAIASGQADQELARLADAEPGTLLVMGLRHAAGVLAPQPGSTAYRVLCVAKTPVLVVPGRAR